MSSVALISFAIALAVHDCRGATSQMLRREVNPGKIERTEKWARIFKEHSQERKEGGPADDKQCRNVFADMGSNRGRHGNFLFEGGKYPSASNMLRVMDDVLGPASERSSGGTCYFGIEAGERHLDELNKLSSCYRQHGLYHKVDVPLALSNHTGTVTFASESAPSGNDLGARIMASGVATHDGSHGVKQVATTVRSVAASEWLQGVLSHKNDEGKAMGKMDIEGAEFAVLSSVLHEAPKLFCASEGGFHTITIEFHERFFDTSVQQRLVDLKTMFLTPQLLQKQISGCTQVTRFLELDSEAYWDQDTDAPHWCMGGH